MVDQFILKASYKYDLASICNLYTLDERFINLHKEGYNKFASVIEQRPDLINLAQQLYANGLNPAVVLITSFDYIDYFGYDIDQLCLAFDDEIVKELLKDYVIKEMMLTTEAEFLSLEPILPLLSQMARHLHAAGFNSYWQDVCLPEIQDKCVEYQRKANRLEIVANINALLGQQYSLSGNKVSVYLCKFAAPYGTSLRNQSLSCDISWDFNTTVATAVHELMHPPFDRQTIAKFAEQLWDDALILKVFRDQTDYNSPLKFIEENIVEAAHVFLSEKMGVLDNPLLYFIEHHNGDHVLSVIIYDQLKKGAASKTTSLKEAVQNMLKDGVIKTGHIWKAYNQIFADAGLAYNHPYQK